MGRRQREAGPGLNYDRSPLALPVGSVLAVAGVAVDVAVAGDAPDGAVGGGPDVGEVAGDLNPLVGAFLLVAMRPLRGKATSPAC